MQSILKCVNCNKFSEYCILILDMNVKKKYNDITIKINFWGNPWKSHDKYTGT